MTDREVFCVAIFLSSADRHTMASFSSAISNVEMFDGVSQRFSYGRNSAINRPRHEAGKAFTERHKVKFSNNCTCREPGRRVIYLLVKKDGTKNVYKFTELTFDLADVAHFCKL